MVKVAIDSAAAADRLLSALGEYLAEAKSEQTLVIVGGAALLQLGLVTRVTKDIDVVAVAVSGRLISGHPLPPAVVAARNRVARTFAVPEDWLNAGPASLMDFGLPEGFQGRAHRRDYGNLQVLVASRLDQIHFKLYATVDQGGGKHLLDLEALGPTGEELVQAGAWTRTHDPSPGFDETLQEVLRYFEARDGSSRS